MSDEAKFSLKLGKDFPFHGKPPSDKYEEAVLGILADLCDRRGVKQELINCDNDIKETIINSLANILREALP